MRLFATGYGRFERVIGFFHADQPEPHARNTIAAIVTGNIPFYPLYAALFVGWRTWPTLLAFLSLPLFILVPAANRLSGRAGRLMLLAAGLVDTGLCAQGLGLGSGVELFYLPIGLLPLVLYREETSAWRAGMIATVALVFLFGRALGGSLATYTTLELGNLTKMHAVSVTLLCLVILILRLRLPSVRLSAQGST